MADNSRSPILGTWQMILLERAQANGAYAAVPYSGQLIFSDAGTLSVQASDANPKAADTAYTSQGYEAYYGPVTIDRDASTFTIYVVSSLVRALEGQSLVRVFVVFDHRLVITPVDPAEGWRVTYARQ